MDINVILDLQILKSKSDYASIFNSALNGADITCPILDFKS